jgi:hypothetical protein
MYFKMGRTVLGYRKNKRGFRPIEPLPSTPPTADFSGPAGKPWSRVNVASRQSGAAGMECLATLAALAGTRLGANLCASGEHHER